NVVRNVELGLHLGIAPTPLVVGMPGTMAMVLADDEERSLDDETEIAMLKRRSVALSHQKADQPTVTLSHFVRGLVEGDTCTVDDGKIGSQSAVKRDKAVVEDRDRVLG